MTKKELENRLIDFSVAVLKAIDQIKNDKKSLNLVEQLVRSCTSAALNYGEAQSAESKKDFIHKIGVIMKELRETQINLSILAQINPYIDSSDFQHILNENDELLAIFHKTIQTARKNP
jgi:four helix bundle protein